MKKKIIVELDEEVLSHIYQHGFFEEKDRHKVGIAILEGKELTDLVEDVRAEIDTEYKKFRNKSDKWDERANGIGTALEIIDRKIKEIKNERS